MLVFVVPASQRGFGLDRLIRVLCLIVPMGIAWVLTHRERGNRWIGRGLFELIQKSRHKEVVRLEHWLKDVTRGLDAQNPNG